jgi:hypothetical protein
VVFSHTSANAGKHSKFSGFCSRFLVGNTSSFVSEDQQFAFRIDRNNFYFAPGIILLIVAHTQTQIVLGIAVFIFGLDIVLLSAINILNSVNHVV